MKQRCENINNKNYRHYGGRGISICERWRHSFENFLDDMGDRPDGMSLDRIDNNGNYEPDNCKFSTQTEQMNNYRKNTILTYKGISHTIPEWSRKLGIRYSTIRGRFDKGWSVEHILTKPIRQRLNVTLTHNGESFTLAEWARQMRLPKGVIRKRLIRGWSIERSLTEPVHPRKPTNR